MYLFYFYVIKFPLLCHAISRTEVYLKLYATIRIKKKLNNLGMQKLKNRQLTTFDFNSDYLNIIKLLHQSLLKNLNVTKTRLKIRRGAVTSFARACT